MPPLRLTLIRHAKSSWKRPELADHDRPLNARGRRDVPRMAERLRERGFSPELILASSALRARLTAEVIADACGLGDRVHVSRGLYHAGADELVDLVDAQLARRRVRHVAVVGHDPGLRDLIARLTGVELEKLPTCGVATVEMEGERIGEANAGDARLALLETPKDERAGRVDTVHRSQERS